MLPPVIYHYTKFRFFKSIARRKQLWLTHYKHVNDTEEITTGLKILDDEAKNYLSKCGKISGSVKLSSEIFDQYFLCFCARHDNDHLWKNYSAKSGIVLGFSTAELLKSTSIAIVPVSYDIDEYRALCREKISSLKPVTQEDEDKLTEYIRTTNDKEGAQRILQGIPNYKEFRDTMSLLSAYATLLKNPSWIKEEEIRLMYWPITCEERGVPLLDIKTINGIPRALLSLETVPLVSITTYSDRDTLKRKGVFNFLQKNNIPLE